MLRAQQPTHPRPNYELAVRAMREALGEGAFTEAWGEGWTISPDAATALDDRAAELTGDVKQLPSD